MEPCPRNPPRGEGNGSGRISFDDEAGKKLLATLAEKLGTTADDPKSKLDGGASLRGVLKEAGVSHEDVRAAFEEAFKSWREYGSSGSAGAAYQPAANAVDVQFQFWPIQVARDGVPVTILRGSWLGPWTGSPRLT